MTLDVEDTIAAIASAPGGGVRGIVRVSGATCAEVLQALVTKDVDDQTEDAHPNPLPEGEGTPWPTCQRRLMRLPGDLGLVPATVYFWPTVSSYTRQPSLEFHLPGSPPMLEAALEAVCAAGARLAGPGEFTLRAFLAGRLDLTQAEAVLGVIEARGHQELQSALVQLAGGLARPLAALRESLLDLLAELEAGLDFVEEDIVFIAAEELDRRLADAAGNVDQLRAQMASRGDAGILPRVAIIGQANVGKSSLLNALAGEEASIVSDSAGTTRDFVARRVKFGQRECLLMDTAGERAAHDVGEVERLALMTARMETQQADLVLLCVDASRPLARCEDERLERTEDIPRLLVWTKCDLAGPPKGNHNESGIRTSSRTGMGLDALRQEIARALEAAAGEGGVVASTADRCRESLHLASGALARSRAHCAGEEELVAAEVRLALEELGRVIGAVYTDDILDRVFGRFCIGK